MKIRKAKIEDLFEIQKLIVNTFKKCNKNEGSPEGVKNYLNQHDPNKNLEQLKKRFEKAEIFFVTVEDEKIIGIIKGSKSKIGNLFVYPKYHRRGIAKKLVDKFEKEAIKLGSNEIKIRASLYAIEFYKKMGYKKTTGIKSIKDIKFQPMRKILE